MFYPPSPWLPWLTSSLQVTASLLSYITRHTKRIKNKIKKLKLKKKKIKYNFFFENIQKKIIFFKLKKKKKSIKIFLKNLKKKEIFEVK